MTAASGPTAHSRFAGCLLAGVGDALGAPVEFMRRSEIEALELRNVIGEVAEDLFAFKDWPIGEYMPESELSRKITTR